MITYNSIPFNIENKIVESYRDGQSMQTIADTLNISIGTVNKYVHKNMTEENMREIGEAFGISAQRVGKIIGRHLSNKVK